jgi:cell wall-associated NlpC family hydrolase
MTRIDPWQSPVEETGGSDTPHPPGPLAPRRRRLLLGLAALMAGCAGMGRQESDPAQSSPGATLPPLAGERQEVVLFSLSLIGIGYRFGGKNPEAGIDCSGMVSYVFQNAVGVSLTGSAADIAKRGRQLPRSELAPADLVFFNTRGGPFTHVGIFIGEGRFIHAPSSNGFVRLDEVDSSYFGRRFTTARTYFG